MTLLSVNVNKIATLRHSRGSNFPDLLKVTKDIQDFGAEGITIHPRPDERHIKYSDARLLKNIVLSEFNIEGDPIPKFIMVRPFELVQACIGFFSPYTSALKRSEKFST